VTSNDRDAVERLDAASGRRLKPLRIGRGAAGIVTDGRWVWVATKDDGEVVRIDARRGRVVERLRPGGRPVKLALGFTSLWVGVTNGYRRTTLIRYRLHGGELSRMDLDDYIAGLATAAGSVWVVERRRPQQLIRVAPRTGARRPWLKMPGSVSQLISDGTFLWATLGGDDMVARVRTNRRNSQVTDVDQSPDTAVAAGGRVFVTNNTHDSVSVLDRRTAELTGDTIKLSAPNPFAITADEHSLWVTGTAENTVTRIAYR
jgi:hypothetical protein